MCNSNQKLKFAQILLKMKEYVLLFRMNILNEAAQPTSEQMEIYMQQWMTWLSEISKKGQLADGGNHLSRQGRVLRPNNQVSEMPYQAEEQSVAGYIIVIAEDLDEATEMAQKCPILNGENTSVEIRETDNP
jgi:hypothetical protein